MSSEADSFFGCIASASVSACAMHHTGDSAPPSPLKSGTGTSSVPPVPSPLNGASFRGRRRLERDTTPPPADISRSQTPAAAGRPVVNLSPYAINDRYQQHLSVPRTRTFSFPEHWTADDKLADDAASEAVRIVQDTVLSVRCAAAGDVAPTVKNMGSRTFLVAEEAALLHVWRSRSEARRFHEALRRAAQAKFEHMVPSPVHVPLAGLVAHQGALVSVVWLPPLYADGCRPVERSSPCWLVADVVRAALHLRRGQAVSLHHAADDRHYLLLSPAVVLHHAYESQTEDTDSGGSVSHALQRVRLELLDVNPAAVALHGAVVADHLLRTAEVEAAKALYEHFSVPDEQRTAALRALPSVTGSAYKSAVGATALHAAGVPMRRAGEVLRVYRHTTTFKSRDAQPFVEAAATVLKAEMIARALVAHLADIAAKCAATHGSSTEADLLAQLMEAEIGETLGRFFRSGSFFKDTLLPIVRAKFFASDDAFADCTIRRDDVRPCLIPVMHFVASRLGYGLAKDHKTIDGDATQALAITRPRRNPLSSPRLRANLQAMIRLSLSAKVPRGVRVRHMLRTLHAAASTGDGELLADAFTTVSRTIEGMLDGASCRDESATAAHIYAVQHMIADAAPAAQFQSVMTKLLALHPARRDVGREAAAVPSPVAGTVPGLDLGVSASSSMLPSFRNAHARTASQGSEGNVASPAPESGDDAVADVSIALPPESAGAANASFDGASSLMFAKSLVSPSSGVHHRSAAAPLKAAASPLTEALSKAKMPVLEESFFGFRLASFADAASTITFAPGKGGPRSLAPQAGAALLAACRHFVRAATLANGMIPLDFVGVLEGLATTLIRTGSGGHCPSWQCADQLTKGIAKLLCGIGAGMTGCDGGAWKARVVGLFTEATTSQASHLIASCGVAKAELPKTKSQRSQSPDPKKSPAQSPHRPSPSRTPDAAAMEQSHRSSVGSFDVAPSVDTRSTMQRGLLPFASAISAHAVRPGEVGLSAEIQFRLHVLLCAAGECGPEIVELLQHLRLTPDSSVRQPKKKVDVATLLTPVSERRTLDTTVVGAAATKEALRVALTKISELTARRTLPADAASWEPVSIVIRGLFNMPDGFDLALTTYRAIRSYIVQLASPAAADAALALPAAGIARVRRVISVLRQRKDPVAREPFRRLLLWHTEDIGMRALLRMQEAVLRDHVYAAFTCVHRDGIEQREAIRRFEVDLCAAREAALIASDEEHAIRTILAAGEVNARDAIHLRFREEWERANIVGIVGRGGQQLFVDDDAFRAAAAVQEDVARRVIELQWAELSSRAKVEAELLSPAHALEVLPRFSILIAEDFLAEFYGALAQSLLPVHESFIAAQAITEQRGRETLRRLFTIDAPRRSYAAQTKNPPIPDAAADSKRAAKPATAATGTTSPSSPPALDTERVTSGDSTRVGASDHDDDAVWDFTGKEPRSGARGRPAHSLPQTVQTSPQPKPTTNAPSPSRVARPLINGAVGSPPAAANSSPKFGRRAAAAAAPQRDTSQPAPTRRRR